MSVCVGICIGLQNHLENNLFSSDILNSTNVISGENIIIRYDKIVLHHTFSIIIIISKTNSQYKSRGLV